MLPAAPLRPYIAGYLLTETARSTWDNHVVHLPSAGMSLSVCTRGCSLRGVCGTENITVTSGVIGARRIGGGQMKLTGSSSRAVRTVTVRFAPAGFCALFGGCAGDLSGKVVPLAQMLGPKGAELTQRLEDAGDDSGSEGVLNEFLLDMLRRARPVARREFTSALCSAVSSCRSYREAQCC
jgi:hypothetical protein